MNDKTIHDLAVAYAQAKLIQTQQVHPDLHGHNEEIRSFLKDYLHALHQLPIEYEDLDEVF